MKGGSLVLAKAKELGASLAGIASVAELKDSPSYQVYHKSPYYKGFKGIEWLEEAKSRMRPLAILF